MLSAQQIEALAATVERVSREQTAYRQGTRLELLEAAALLRSLAAPPQQPDELHVMQMAAISTASIQNTRESAKERIGRDNPYWTQAYDDVCRAVDREMDARERAELYAAPQERNA
jgi:hypothetical protein